MVNVKHTTDNGEILTTNCKRVATALKHFAEFLGDYDRCYNDMLNNIKSANDNNTTTFTNDRYNTITMTLSVNDSNDKYTLTIKHTHNAPKTIWCICNNDGNIKDFTDRKELFEYAYKNNLYGDFEIIWVEEKELKDEKHDYYETVDYETLDLYKIRTMLELDICDMKITNDNETPNGSADGNKETATNNKTPAELKAEINKKYGINAVYYDTDSILCDTEKHKPYIIKAYYDGKELSVPYSVFECRQHAVDYIKELFVNNVVDCETLFIIYHGKHAETITIDESLDIADLIEYDIGVINVGLIRNVYKKVREGVKRLCNIINGAETPMKICISLNVGDNEYYHTITKSRIEGLYTFKSGDINRIQSPESFARWLYYHTFTHSIELKCWYYDLSGETK